MELFGIGPMELILVFILALVFIGPGKMPELAASLGKAIREFRAASAELTDALNAEIAEAERRKAGAAAENGHHHSETEAADAEVVAQGSIEPPIEYATTEAAETVDAPAEPAEPVPPAEATIDDVLAAIALQDAQAAAEREAEAEAARAAARAEELARIGLAPLPESLLLPSTDLPLVVVNPTGSAEPAPAEGQEPPADNLPGADVDSVGPESVVEEDEEEAPLPPAEEPDGLVTPEPAPLEASGLGRSEVL